MSDTIPTGPVPTGPASTDRTSTGPVPAGQADTTIGRADLVRLLVRLRIRLTVASMSRFGRLAYGVLALGVLGFAIVGALVVAVLPRPDEAPEIVFALALGSVVLWTVGSAAMGSSQYAVDPRRLQLMPIPTDRLLSAFLASAVLTIPAAATAVISVAFITHAPSAVGVVALIVLVICHWFICLLSGRAAATALEALLGGRRARDLAVFFTALAAVTIGLSTQFAALFVTTLVGLVEPVRAVARWTPWGWSAEAITAVIEQRWTVALAWSGPTLALAGGLYLAWSRLTVRNLTQRPDNPTSRERGTLIAGPLRLVPPGPTVAVWSRALRQLRRDVRELAELAGLLPLALIATVPAAALLGRAAPVLVLLCGAGGGATAVISLNLFGADARSFGVDLLVAPDPAPVLWGKIASRLTVIGVPILVVLVAMAAWTSGWSMLPLGFLVAVATSTVAAAAGLAVSVRAPIPLPDLTALGGLSANPAAFGAMPVRVGLLLGAGLFGLTTVTVVFALWRLSPAAGWVAAVVLAAIGVSILIATVRSLSAELRRRGPEFLTRLTLRSP